MRSGLRAAAAALGVFLLAVPAVRAVDRDAIDKAIQRGVIYLKRQQQRDGTWPYHGKSVAGATALAALTLLECDVPADDPAIKAAADWLRQASVPLDHTYSLALAVMFFDRLGERRDVALIESMAVRLLAGQNAEGGWTYSCPPIGGAEARRLAGLIQQKAPPREGLGGKLEPRDDKRTVHDLPLAIQQQLVLINRMGGRRGGGGDNSNTQFATLALWVARRHGLPVDGALARVDARFRLTQHPDGGWGYTATRGVGGTPSTPAMTCAGLLGLAVGHGAANDADGKGQKRDPNKDASLRAGLVALGTSLGHPAGRVGRPGLNVPVIGERNGKAYYFLWSLERVAVALGLDTIGKKDWYAWGSEVLLANQGADGSWRGEYTQGGVDTCFALLFLRRANLAADLTASIGKIRDPGEVELRAGGVGGGALQRKGLRKALAPEGKDERTASRPRQDKLKPIPSEIENDVAERLSNALVRAGGAKRDRLLEELRENKGVDNTEALAFAIPRLDGVAKRAAREALAGRLARMTPETLRRYMTDVDPEIRRAAVLASAMRDLRPHTPAMIDRLGDGDPDVVRAARAALKAMTGRDFGPADGATRAEHEKAVADWKAWWKRQGGK